MISIKVKAPCRAGRPGRFVGELGLLRRGFVFMAFSKFKMKEATVAAGVWWGDGD
jgi:hypothetical protein